MKTVGKQLQEARLAKNWTPELAARETKIKVDRLRDLERDDYSHFTSPAYARGFVRTYARALGLDEYKILRQLDNKLPDDDHANLVPESGAGYLPETSMPPHVAHRDYTGLYVVMTLGCIVTLVIAFILFEAYRVGELKRYFADAESTESTSIDANATTNAVPIANSTNSVARALPVDSNTPPPITEPTPTPAAVADDSTNTIKALPVDPASLAGNTNAPPIVPPRAMAVDPAELTNAAPQTVALNTPSVAPRAVAVDAAELALDTNAPAAIPPVAVAVPSPTPAPIPVAPLSARQSNSGIVLKPAPAPLIPPVPSPTPIPALLTNAAPHVAMPQTVTANKRLILTASQDSFVRVTSLDPSDSDKALYASVLHSGQSVGFDGHKFSINVGVPSAVDIKLDGVNYGPHSDQEVPETFTVESHQP